MKHHDFCLYAGAGWLRNGLGMAVKPLPLEMFNRWGIAGSIVVSDGKDHTELC